MLYSGDTVENIRQALRTCLGTVNNDSSATHLLPPSKSRQVTNLTDGSFFVWFGLVFKSCLLVTESRKCYAWAGACGSYLMKCSNWHWDKNQNHYRKAFRKTHMGRIADVFPKHMMLFYSWVSAVPVGFKEVQSYFPFYFIRWITSIKNTTGHLCLMTYLSGTTNKGRNRYMEQFFSG